MPQVLGIKRLHGEKFVRSGMNRVWFCDGCGMSFLWDDSSMVYGSRRDEDNSDFDRLWIACSQSCADKKPSGFPRKQKGEL